MYSNNTNFKNKNRIRNCQQQFRFLPKKHMVSLIVEPFKDHMLFYYSRNLGRFQV